MNFLAHLVLAPPTPEGLIGSIAPDMIRGPLPADLHPSVLASAREHQRIDRFTDAHRSFSQTRDRLRATVDTRLAGVLADVLYDHVLACEWAHYRDDDLAGFLSETEQHLVGMLEHVPFRMQMIVRKMIDEQWLASYATTQGVCARLQSMSQRLTKRLGRPMSLAVSEQDLTAFYRPIADDFAKLWPDLLLHVKRHRDNPSQCIAS